MTHEILISVEPEEGQIWEIGDADRSRLVRLTKAYSGWGGKRMFVARVLDRRTMRPVQRRLVQLPRLLLTRGNVGGRTATLVRDCHQEDSADSG